MNPHRTDPTVIDIRASADQVLGLLRIGHTDEAIRALERARGNERPVVQEALDRLVWAGGREVISRPGFLDNATGASAEAILRLQEAGAAPRMPDHSTDEGEPNEFAGLTAAQLHDVYASIAEVQGADAVVEELRRDNNVVLLGLRRETPTWASTGGSGRAGTGVYDDRIIVLARDADGNRSAFVALRASTEPTAQYAHHARLGEGRASPVYEGVTRLRPEQGEDVDGDRVRDLGRMAEGTYELEFTTHRNPASAGTNDALRPSERFFRAGGGGGMIQRDTNGDGYFNGDDVNGVQDLNSSFKIHSGSRSNTDSAGCQTIHPDDYQEFIDAVRTNAAQEFVTYVLVTVDNSRERAVQAGRAAPREAVAELSDAAHRPGRTGEGAGVPAVGPFENPALNRYYAAVVAGDPDRADRIALGFADRFPAWGAAVELDQREGAIARDEAAQALALGTYR